MTLNLDIDAYLRRIKFQAPHRPEVSLNTLCKLQHQHLLNIPYENIDVQLNVSLDFDLQRIFNKLVANQRGGWCYEMNGLLGWALESLGFNVRRMSGAVNRASMGDAQLANHLVLEVVLDNQAYLVDTGLGDGLREPIPIKAGQYTQNGLTYGLEELADGYWRMHNHALSNVASFDFKHETADESALAAKCQWLQTSPDSPFKMVLIAQRFTAEGIHVQLGKISTFISASGKQSREITTIEALHEHLADTFGLQVDLHSIWPDIEAAHERFIKQQT